MALLLQWSTKNWRVGYFERKWWCADK